MSDKGKVLVFALRDAGEIHFIELRPYGEPNRVTVKSWWRGHWHALKLIFSGYDLQLEPES